MTEEETWERIIAARWLTLRHEYAHAAVANHFDEGCATHIDYNEQVASHSQIFVRGVTRIRSNSLKAWHHIAINLAPAFLANNNRLSPTDITETIAISIISPIGLIRALVWLFRHRKGLRDTVEEYMTKDDEYRQTIEESFSKRSLLHLNITLGRKENP